MRLIDYLNPVYIADRWGNYYLGFVFGAAALFLAIGATCGG